MIDPVRWIDITLPIRPDMPLYPGDAAPCVRRLASLESGDPLTLSEITLGCHVGTHIDAPAHFVAGGATVDQLDRACFVGPAVVLDLTGRKVITASDVQRLTVPPRRHILLKTDNSALLHRGGFDPAYCTLSVAAAAALLALAPLSIGIDYYSLDPPAEADLPAHRAVALAGRPVFVCLDLSGVSAGSFTFIGLPLPVAGVEGMPVRAFLVPYDGVDRPTSS
ncbi:MAG: cyclase family protein [Proteobacteria bacterium]|nr:cyclase family protein [Pseudomonadota bacterium]